jgi:hypothetical protein
MFAKVSASRGPPRAEAIEEASDMQMLSWVQWQQAVLVVLRGELAEVLAKIDFDEVDWPAWQNLYTQGRSPQSAVNRALERDL